MRTHTLAVRLAAGFLPLTVMLGAASARQPVLPTVPQPVPAPRGHAVLAQVPLPAPVPVEAARGEAGPELSLGECVSIALARQPSLRAVLESTAAVEIGYKSLSNFGTAATLFSPDVDVRKQQAKRGLMATSAEYQKLHNELVQDVTRMYYTAVYAKQQQELANRVVLRLDNLIEIGREYLKTAPAQELKESGFNTLKLQMMENGLYEAKKLQIDARIGRERALAGLRELMAVDARTFPFRIKDQALPVMVQEVPLTMTRVAELALERRPELVLAAAGVDAFRLEVYAQGKIPFKRATRTFVSGADIHAKEIPATNRGADYRPGGIIPEMPPQLVGSKYDRVCRAMAFAQRAEAVYDKARNLILLEAETAYLDFDQAARRLEIATEQFALSKRIQEQARAVAEFTKSKDQLVLAEVEASRAQSGYFEAVHRYLLALAALERVTAGGIWPKFPDR
ncbi:TolC family protein [Gemmata sp. JC717]|uniref:TolC family protein n=1 Tax=Gemmata algarum TaxID=2975278 RepID=A0ABU5F3S4_9BACT|nr:TolC family protein [Gemmata algarum]MDY3551110.1 TolC family protein [Gemmata algarum]MDY3561980.1 TolC family protein [Gemmata algarum]